MPMLYVVTAIDRTSLGLQGSWRGGRFWPSSASITVEVQDTDECPVLDDPSKPGKTMLDPNRIGRIAWARIMNDPTLSKNPAPEGAKLASVAKKTSQEIEAENNELRQSVADLLAALEKELLGSPSVAPAPMSTPPSEPPPPAVSVPAPDVEAPAVPTASGESPKAKAKPKTDKTWGRKP